MIIRIKSAIQRLLTMTNHLFQHTEEPSPSQWERTYLCSAAPISAEAMRDRRPDK